MVSGKLTTSDGYPISGKPIWLTINDEDGEGTGIFVTTNSNGQFETNFDITSGMKISDWTVQAFFDGDTNYFASVSNYRYFTVGSTNVSLTHTTLTFDYISTIQSGDSVILTGSLNTLDGTPISGKTILITIYPDNGGTGHGEYVTNHKFKLVIMIILSILFFVTAILYSSVGFGGGSTYLALLLIWQIPYYIFPIIALCCNIIVVSGNCFNYTKVGNLNFKLLLPYLIGSIPLSFIGGSLTIEKKVLKFYFF